MTLGMPHPWSDHDLLFISGLHRSGTTQLNATLASHPDVSGFQDTGAPHDEGQHLQDVYPTARQHGGPGRFAFDARSHLTEDSPLATAENAVRLFEQWAQHWDLSRRVLVEKSPPNLVQMRFLQALFPEAGFVVVVRHPVVTALATRKLATTWWMRRTFRTAPLDETLEHWFAAHRWMLADLPQVRRRHVLRWEDLCRDTSTSLRGIAELAGIDGRFRLPDLDAANEVRYVEEWAAIQGDRRQMARLGPILEANADLGAAFGYDLTDLTALERPVV
jgi:hypothetical protein